jgi:multidrug efflux system membrane fusion protein
MRTIWIYSLLALTTLGACKQKQSEDVTPAAVETAAVREVDSGSGIRYSATIEPDTQVTVAFRVGGYVDAVNAEEGDRVAQGAVLARIRQNDYVERAGQATAQRAQAEAALVQAKSDAERAKKLFEANALTKPELDAAIARYDMTQAQANGGRAVANEAGITLRDTTLVAPISGVILRKSIERGDLGAPGAPAFIIAATNTVKVVFGVPDTMIRMLKVGEPIDVATESIPDHTFAGRISRIAPAADSKSRSFDIEVHIANPQNELKPGMVASLEISRGGSQSLAVPLSAVIRPPKSPEGYAVFIVANDKVAARSVDLGAPMGNLVLVRGGLQKGERVVTSGPALLVDGQTVRVIGE